MTMPETTMNEDNLPAAPEDQIRLPWQRLGMQPVSISQGMNETANGPFWLGVLGFHQGHSLASFFWRHRVDHGWSDVLHRREIAPDLFIQPKRSILMDKRIDFDVFVKPQAWIAVAFFLEARGDDIKQRMGFDGFVTLDVDSGRHGSKSRCILRLVFH